MRAKSAVRHVVARTQPALVLGLVDGLLNVLTLAAGSLVGSAPSVTYGLALRIGVAALITSAFAVFVAEYAERRSGLVRASRELNLTGKGRLASTRLGHFALTRALTSTGVACASSFTGACVPLLVGAAVPGLSWVVVVLAVGTLAAFGGMLGHLFAGQEPCQRLQGCRC